MEPRDIHRSLVRTILAVCRCAQSACDADVREDIADACAALLDGWIAGGPDRIAVVRSWCRDAEELLGRLDGADGIEAYALLRARAQVLRLRSILGVPATPAAAPRSRKVRPSVPALDLGANQEQVLERVRSNPGMRTKDIIASFVGELSDRTVKRSLGELNDAGIVRRTKDGGAVAYRAVDAD